MDAGRWQRKKLPRSDEECFLIKTMVIDKLCFTKFGFDSLHKAFDEE